MCIIYLVSALSMSDASLLLMLSNICPHVARIPDGTLSLSPIFTLIFLFISNFSSWCSLSRYENHSCAWYFVSCVIAFLSGWVSRFCLLSIILRSCHYLSLYFCMLHHVLCLVYPVPCMIGMTRSIFLCYVLLTCSWFFRSNLTLYDLACICVRILFVVCQKDVLPYHCDME